MDLSIKRLTESLIFNNITFVLYNLADILTMSSLCILMPVYLLLSVKSFPY